MQNGFIVATRASTISGTKKLVFLVLALSYGCVLSQLPDTDFMDFENYLRYAKTSSLMLSLWQVKGVLATFANEPVWLLINAGLAHNFSPETVVRIIIFCSAFSVSWLVLRHHPEHFGWLILFLLLPQVIKNHLIHLRQGAAIAIFLMGWFSVNRKVRWLLLGIAPLVHASFFFILALMWLTLILRTIYYGPVLRTIAFVAAGIVGGVGISWLAQAVGARQAGEYAFQAAEVSGLGFLLWTIILAIILTARRAYLREHAFETGVIFFYLATYWLIEIAARVFESGLMLVLISGLMLPGWRRQVFLAAVLGSGALQWILQLGKPALGFGIG